MSIDACLLQPVVQDETLSILSPQGDLLLFYDRNKGQLELLNQRRTDRPQSVLHYDPQAQTLSLRVGDQVFSQPVEEWSSRAGEELVQHFRRMGLEIHEDFLSATQRGDLFRYDSLSPEQQQQALQVYYEGTCWDGPWLLFTVEGRTRRWNPVSRRLDDRPIESICACTRKLHGDTKIHTFFYLAFDELVLVQRGKQYFETLSSGDPSNTYEVERAYGWVCDNLQRPYECSERPWSKPQPTNPPSGESTGCSPGCLAGLAALLGLAFLRG